MKPQPDDLLRALLKLMLSLRITALTYISLCIFFPFHLCVGRCLPNQQVVCHPFLSLWSSWSILILVHQYDNNHNIFMIQNSNDRFTSINNIYDFRWGNNHCLAGSLQNSLPRHRQLRLSSQISEQWPMLGARLAVLGIFLASKQCEGVGMK